MISNPQWGPGGDYIYFICWNFSDEPQCICRTDPEGKDVEVVKKTKGYSLLCEVAPVGNRLAYWEKETIEDGNISWGVVYCKLTSINYSNKINGYMINLRKVLGRETVNCHW